MDDPDLRTGQPLFGICLFPKKKKTVLKRVSIRRECPGGFSLKQVPGAR